ncbi:MAG: GNAT family N-acetyltransferase [Treponema sp.]|nr:GNAT family N-acetyltransferase [Treponema sp.]
MEFKKAAETDLEEIMRLVQSAVTHMNEAGIHQWDDIYPAKEDFLSDIKAGSLYKGSADGGIAVLFALNTCQDEAYLTADWSYTGTSFSVLHRLCVHPDFQHQGRAKETLDWIEAHLKARGVKAVRLDVFSENPYALRLYEKAGYRQTGTADWRKGRFYLMEKVL